MGELLVDDFSFSSDYKPDMIGYQAGIEVRRPVRPGRMLGFSAEFNRVNNYVYSHDTGEDFSFDGLPTGYLFGPDVEYSAGEVWYEHDSRWEVGVRSEYFRKGEGHLGDAWSKSVGKVDAGVLSGVVEREVRVGGWLTFTPARWLRIEGRAGTSSIKNKDHVPSISNDSETPISARAEVVW